MNRLAQESSPYLKQHSGNPVDWYAWGEEALAKSRAEDKPILLSIGYSACHWCHVMERESFESEATAAVMNELFVNIKVDREERPDLDQIYQLVVQLMGRSGGWPLTVFLTPDKKPFFGGTYFPPVERFGMPAFTTVLRAVSEAYRARRSDVERSAAEITRAIGEVTAIRSEPGEPPEDVLTRAARSLGRTFDDVHGGFGDQPKFPNTMALDVLLRANARHGDDEALRRVRLALDAMRENGVYDQIGGGFHRYSTDARWRIPHFEKMLYDNALLARLCLDAWRATGEERYADTVRETLAYVEREMRSPEGAFYSTQDADSEGEEGKFFVWTPEEVEAVLGDADARVACLYWGIAPGGNFEHGTTVPFQSRSIEALAKQLEPSEAEVRATLERARAKLFEARESRPKPFRDEKVIASWNGLMIGAFAEAGGALDDARLVGVAQDALRFVQDRMWQDGALMRIYADGKAKVPAFLDDHADLACAALDVYEASFDERALAFGRALVEAALERFYDAAEGGFWFAPPDSADLVVRAKDAYDNAVPSGTSSMCHALLRLHALLGDERFLAPAEVTIRQLGARAMEHPMGFGHLLGAIDRYVHGATEIAIVAAADDADAHALALEARRAYLPTRALARVAPDAPADARGVAATLGGRRQREGKATAYVCRGRTCSEPVTTVEALRPLLGARM